MRVKGRKEPHKWGQMRMHGSKYRQSCMYKAQNKYRKEGDRRRGNKATRLQDGRCGVARGQETVNVPPSPYIHAEGCFVLLLFVIFILHTTYITLEIDYYITCIIAATDRWMDTLLLRGYIIIIIDWIYRHVITIFITIHYFHCFSLLL